MVGWIESGGRRIWNGPSLVVTLLLYTRRYRGGGGGVKRVMFVVIAMDKGRYRDIDCFAY